MLKLCRLMAAILVGGQESSDTTFKRGPPKDHPCISLVQIGSSGFRGRRFLKNFLPIFSYFKTMSTDGGHLGWRVGSLDTTFKRGLPKDYPCQVWSQIGSVVSEEKIFKEFFADIFLF